MSRLPVTDHCDGHRFFTPGAPPLPHFGKVLRWRFTRRVPDWQPHAITPRPDGSEFTAWRWMSPRELIECVVEFRRGPYAQILGDGDG